ncbi:MAG TPA: sulfate ABC transporter permease subunit CysT [Solirubrobacteraceae bacterium]|nr:sulfate ABC transporter permease subunit CysT [Solirubrobacteraceae bacterium]
MSADALAARLGLRRRWRGARSAVATGPGALGAGVAMLWLTLIVLLPLAFVVAKASHAGLSGAWDVISDRESFSALGLTVVASLVVTAINVVVGTLTAWVLVRDAFPGKRVVNALIDLPFAMPTVVAGLTLLVLYGPDRPVGINLAFTRWSVVMAMLFVTLPFVVRSVQPVLIELDREVEEAASSLGAGSAATLRRIVLPSLAPAIASGAALAFARAVGEYGSLVLITGSIPFKTEVSSVLIVKSIENDLPVDAAVISTELLAISVVILMLLRAFGRPRA